MPTSQPRATIQTGQVASHRRVCSQHYLLTVRLPSFAEAAPGQFVHLGSTQLESRTGDGVSAETMMNGQGFGSPFLRRAFSVGELSIDASGVLISVLLRVVGTGTRWLANLKAGDSLSVLGPLGMPFELASNATRAILVAGGVGLPPLAWYGREICESGGKVMGVLGARSKEFVALYEGTAVEEMSQLQSLVKSPEPMSYPQWWLATDDGSAGFHGTAAAALDALLANSDQELAGWTVFTCGPDRMMHAVSQVCSARAMRCFVCLEREMACGTGTCQSCAVAVNDAQAPDGWRFKLCCKDGPVFAAQEVRW